MLTIRPGSHTHNLLILLSYVGEIPSRSLQLLGNKKSWSALIQKLNQPQDIRLPDTNERLNCRLLTVNGKGKMKTIRLYKAALPILEKINPEAFSYYMEAFNQHHFSGDQQQIDRNHRVAEAVMMCLAADIETRQYVLPVLQNVKGYPVVPDCPCMYTGRELKWVGEDAENKTKFSRVVGALFYPGGCHVVFNSRAALMKWNGTGENKVRDNLEIIARSSADVPRLDDAILFGVDYSVALRTLQAAHQNRKLDLRFDAIYPQIHFIPMNQNGVRMLKTLSLPDWKEAMLDILFDPDDRAIGPGSFEYDAKVNDVFVLSHLDGDIARLMRFREALPAIDAKTEVLCYSFQTDFLKEYLGDRVQLRTVEIAQIENALAEEG